MSNGPGSAAQSGLSIVFFGRRCPFSAIPLERLLRAGVNVSALILSSPAPIGDPVRLRRYRPSIGIAGAADSVDSLAGERGIPLYDARRPLGSELQAVLRQHRPDLLVASCFPWFIPAPIRQTARFGGVNLHPSLLPRFRGPDPLFWAYRYGERAWGITVHRLCDSFDAGAILAQKGFAIPDELPGDRLERHAARLGAELLLDVIARANSGTLLGSTQDESVSSYESWPGADQLLVEREWSVRRAINFVVGVRPLGYEPAINTTRGVRRIRSARPTNANVHSGETWLDDHSVRVPFFDGVVEFTVS